MSITRNPADSGLEQSRPPEHALACVGVNIGALTVKAVALRGDEKIAQVRAHQGRPREVLQEMLAATDFAEAGFFGVSGPLGHLSEVAAIQRALQELDAEFDAVVSLGGESFLVYLVADKRIIHLLAHNKCAAGSGEFLVQQIGRMGLGLETAICRSFAGQVVPLAARCSVHCKSDITHKLNRNEATPEDILRTLHDGMASKVIALLEKAQRELPRVLLIGGVSRNAAMLAALREHQPGTVFVVRPESPWLEAWGSALLTRDEPLYRSPQLSVPAGLARLPPLRLPAGRVQVIAAPPRPPPPDHPLVLGLDAGSTTTKAVLLDPATRGVVAAHYARTRGDPVAAARECVQALARQAGNHRVSLAATTGSARELVGAYLGTEHVFNEISAQAAGASHFDPEVDTIFEIGGQDAKYIRLRHGVPMDYAMNNACSAGTGSFLEESAQGDLGIAVGDIAGLALAAPAPVQFKATCAAFINSDIRLAQQQGHSREDIVAGLVYAIATNYLTKVKGQRPVGKKIFLQGGVALNHALGAAFAQSLDRPVVIPPHPELLGALGVALLALDRSRTKAAVRSKSEELDEGKHGTRKSREPAGWKACTTETAMDAGTELLRFAQPEMKLVSRFTCRACKLYCSIDRFEVAGRRFPFGGRCSLYEHVWKRTARTIAAGDLVAQRAELLFGGAKGVPPDAAADIKEQTKLCSSTTQEVLPGGGWRNGLRKWRPAVATPPSLALPDGDWRIGIPKALTTHSLYPLYATFFSNLGLEPVLSGVDPRGDLKANAGFCFPAQLAHGAVLELAKRGVKQVFLPHVLRMPQEAECRDSYLCPITQAGPYFLAKAFPAIRFLSPMLDFTQGYAASLALIELAVRDLGQPRERAEQAWLAAVRAQTETESALRQLGQTALALAVAEGQPAILLAGHSYNAFSPEASQSVGKKLSSLGIPVIPADCLAPVAPGPTAWHFANQILNAVALARQHPNLFLLCVSNFSCTIDAFTQARLNSQLGTKPWLILEIDAHTADAGVQTRLEAFLDIVRNYQAETTARLQPFVPCRLTAGGRVQRSNGDLVSLTEPRVRLVIPNFSQIHTQALAMVARWSGLHPVEVRPLERRQVDRGLQFTSGRECLPLPICLGQLLEAVDRRQPGEIIGFFMVRGGAPCVVDSYMDYFERFIAEQRLADVFMFDPRKENDYAGFDLPALTRALSAAIPVADILVEMEYVLRVVGTNGEGHELVQSWEQLAAQSGSLDQFQARLSAFIDQLAALPRARDPLACPRIAVTGDFFTRFSPFFMEGIAELYARRGIILKPVDVSDLLLYAAYQGVAGVASDWGMKPGAGAFAKACTRILQPDGKAYLQQWLNYRAEANSDAYYRGLFRRTGLLVGGTNEIPELFARAAAHVSPALVGEVIPTVGKGLEAAGAGYDGLIIIGPFNCLPYRISEAVLKPLSLQQGMPMLTYESDGYAVGPTFVRQVEVHIQQVLDRAAQKGPMAAKGTNGLGDKFRSALAKWA